MNLQALSQRLPRRRWHISPVRKLSGQRETLPPARRSGLLRLNLLLHSVKIEKNREMSILQPNMLPLLYQQHVQYSAELARTHMALGKLYKKLAKVGRVLAEREQRELSRADRKKWQFTRTVSKRGVANLEMEQSCLHQKLEQLNGLIASYEQCAYHPPITPWTAAMPPSPFMFTPYSPIGYPAWTSHTSQRSSDGQSETQTQYWDLSMLRERRQSSPYGSPADSGYHEPPI